MANPFSFITANFVAERVGYDMKDWASADTATHAYFSPLDTFPARFRQLLEDVRALGFDRLDLWGAHLHYRWATLGHLRHARALLREYDLTITSYAAWVHGTVDDLATACDFCRALDIPYIAGVIEPWSTHRAECVRLLRESGVRYAQENHDESSAAEMLARIGATDTDVAGLCLDTGWCGTQGLDALATAQAVRDRLFVVHLKDVAPRRPTPIGRGMTDLGHETTALGDGIVNLAEVTRFLRESSFTGPIGLEHEPEDRDPRPELQVSRARALAWWQAA